MNQRSGSNKLIEMTTLGSKMLTWQCTHKWARRSRWSFNQHALKKSNTPFEPPDNKLHVCTGDTFWTSQQGRFWWFYKRLDVICIISTSVETFCALQVRWRPARPFLLSVRRLLQHQQSAGRKQAQRSRPSHTSARVKQPNNNGWMVSDQKERQLLGLVQRKRASQDTQVLVVVPLASCSVCVCVCGQDSW